MRYMRHCLIYFLFFLTFSISRAGDTLYAVQITPRNMPADLEFSPAAELGHILGPEFSSYLRLAPNSNGFISLPSIHVPLEEVFLHYQWMKAGWSVPDTFLVELTGDNGVLFELKRYTEGTGRAWQGDSIALGDWAGQTIRIRFRHNTSGVFPSQYLNLSHIFLKRTGMPVSVTLWEIEQAFHVFPVPARDVLYVGLGTPAAGSLHIRCFNLLGKEVYSKMLSQGETQDHIPLHSFLPGTYILEMKGDNIMGTRKFIVQ